MKKKIPILILIGFILMISAQLNGWFDEDLFSSGSDTSDILKPNILIMMDNSGSMNNLIYHPDYDSSISYTNPAGDGIESYGEYKIELYNAQTYYCPLEGEGWKSFDKGYYFGNRGTTYHTYKATETTFDGVYVLNIKDQPHIGDNPDANPIYLFSQEDSGNEVRISGNFLNFMIYDATVDQRDLWDHFMQYGIWGEGDKSGWDTTNLDGNYGMNRKVRIG